MRSAIILGTIAWLAYSGYGSSKSYYVTVAELGGMGDKAYKSNLRVEGFVKPGSIEQSGTNVTFILNEFESHSPKAATGRLLKVRLQGLRAAAGHIQGRCPGPGPRHIGRDGVFHASELQAKCASKYAPAPGQPRQPTSPPPRQIPRCQASAPTKATSASAAAEYLHARLAPEAESSTPVRPSRQVSKLFGSFAALRQVSVDLEPGRCYVLIGENGAGKSTLLRILAGLLRPTHGTVKVFGDLEPHEARDRIGYMSHAPMLYDELTAPGKSPLLRQPLPGQQCLTPAEALRQVGLDPDLQRPSVNIRRGCGNAPRSPACYFPFPSCFCSTSPSPTWTSRACSKWSSCSPAFARAIAPSSSPPISATRRPDRRLGAGTKGRPRRVVRTRERHANEDQRRALPRVPRHSVRAARV